MFAFIPVFKIELVELEFLAPDRHLVICYRKFAEKYFFKVLTFGT